MRSKGQMAVKVCLFQPFMLNTKWTSRTEMIISNYKWNKHEANKSKSTLNRNSDTLVELTRWLKSTGKQNFLKIKSTAKLVMEFVSVSHKTTILCYNLQISCIEKLHYMSETPTTTTTTKKNYSIFIFIKTHLITFGKHV